MQDEFSQIMNSLADRFCERRAYACLFRFLPAYYALNGLTDGWDDCRNALANTRSFCHDDLKKDEMNDINTALNIIDRMLSKR
jgi:hypothetical protein